MMSRTTGLVASGSAAVLLAGCPFAMGNDYFIAGDDTTIPGAGTGDSGAGPPNPPPPPPPPTIGADATSDAPKIGNDVVPPGIVGEGGCSDECSGPKCDPMKPPKGCADASCKSKDCP